jgi:hypothetical protein
MIQAEKAEHQVPVSMACRLLGVSRSGFNDWSRRSPTIGGVPPWSTQVTVRASRSQEATVPANSSRLHTVHVSARRSFSVFAGMR